MLFVHSQQPYHVRTVIFVSEEAVDKIDDPDEEE